MSMDNYDLRDLFVQSHLALDFPAQFVATMQTPACSNVGLSEFYHAFCKKNGIDPEIGTQVIFTPAAVLGYLFTTFLLPQQEFFSSISASEKVTADEWGLSINRGNATDLRTITRRLRNALSHGHILITKDFSFTFWDAQPGVSDIRDAEVIYCARFDDLMFKFIPKWKTLVTPLLL